MKGGVTKLDPEVSRTIIAFLSNKNAFLMGKRAWF